MKKLLISLLLVFLLAGCVQMSAEEIAKKMQEMEEQIKDFRAEVITVSEGPLGESKQSYTYIFKKPYKFYMENENFIAVSNGSVMWSYDRINNKVMVLESNFNKSEPIKIDYTKIIKDMHEHYDVQLLGEEKVSGRDCYVLNLKPKGDESNVTKMWVDKEFWFPVRMETKFGEFRIYVEYRNLSFNTGIDDSFFEFKPPEGAEVEKMQISLPENYDSVEEAQEHVNFTILVPSYTAGYELESVSVLKNTVTLSYSNGDNFLMIRESTEKSEIPENFEEVEVSGEKAYYGEIYGYSALYLEKNGIQIEISGKIPKEELLKIAQSLG